MADEKKYDNPIPQHLLDDAAEAEALALRNAKPVEPAEPVAAPAEAAPVEAPVETAPETPAAPETPEPAQPEMPVVAPDELQQKFDRLSQAHKTLVGKYRAEVPDRVLAEKAVRQENEALKEQLREAKASQPAPGATPDNFELTQEEQELGPEVWSIAKKASAKRTAELEARLKRLEESRQAAPSDPPKPDDARTELTSTLTAIMPDWASVNNRFIAFVKTNPVAGNVWNSALQSAVASGDAFAVSELFTEWQKSQTVAVPAPARPSVASQVAPRTVSGAPTPSNQPKQYTWAQWEDENLKLVQGRLTPQDAVKLKAELDAAVGEHRVH